MSFCAAGREARRTKTHLKKGLGRFDKLWQSLRRIHAETALPGLVLIVFPLCSLPCKKCISSV